MAISSNGLAGLKPGVVDSTATRPASPFEGQMIYQKDTDQLLVWNGSSWLLLPPTASPTFTGVPAAPTASAGTNTTQLATTAFVQTANSGSIIQVVQGTLSSQTAPAGTSYSDTGLAATITPKSTSSKILVTISFAWYHTNGKGDVNIVRGSTQIAETNPMGVDANNPSGFCSMTYLDSPSTTSATTYKVQYRTGGGGFYFAHANRTNTIVLQEIAG